MLNLKQARRVVILVVGVSVLGIGVAMLVLPGPGMVVIPTGLAILGTEFLWARRLLKRIRERAGSLARGIGGSSRDPGSEDGGRSGEDGGERNSQNVGPKVN